MTSRKSLPFDFVSFRKQELTNQVLNLMATSGENPNENHSKCDFPFAIRIFWENVHMQQQSN